MKPKKKKKKVKQSFICTLLTLDQGGQGSLTGTLVNANDNLISDYWLKTEIGSCREADIRNPKQGFLGYLLPVSNGKSQTLITKESTTVDGENYKFKTGMKQDESQPL